MGPRKLHEFPRLEMGSIPKPLVLVLLVLVLFSVAVVVVTVEHVVRMMLMK